MNHKTEFVGLHHGSLLVQDLAISLNFYCNIIGLRENPLRPEMAFDGAWLDIGEQQIHLLNIPESIRFSDQSRPEHAGRDRHLAFHVRHIEGIQQNLDNHQIPYTMSQSGRQALFCRDPDGNGLEFIEFI
jgi:glyoxylase I family protein